MQATPIHTNLHVAYTLLKPMARHDSLSVTERDHSFHIVANYSSLLTRIIERIENIALSIFENLASNVFHHKLTLSKLEIGRKSLSSTFDFLQQSFGKERLTRAIQWAGIHTSKKRAEQLSKKELGDLFHALSLITTDDIQELLSEIHSRESTVRLSITGQQREELRFRFVNKNTVDDCSFEEIKILESILLPFNSPENQFMNDPGSRFNSLSLFAFTESSLEGVAWSLHLLRSKPLSVSDWEIIVAKRLTQPRLPHNLLIPHPNQGYLCLSHRIEGGGASKRLFRSLHPNHVNPMILYRGTRGPTPGNSLSDVILSWREDIRKELGASGSISTYERTKKLLKDPSLGFVSFPEQPVSLLTHSLGGAQAMRDAILFHKKVTRLATTSSPGIDKETAELFRRVMVAPRHSPMTIIHTIDQGDIIDTVGDEHLGGDCDNVSLTFRALSPKASSPPSHADMCQKFRDFFQINPSMFGRIFDIFKAHVRVTVVEPYSEITLSTDDPKTREIANNYAKHLPPHFDTSWEKVRSRWVCPDSSPGFSSFAERTLCFS